MDQNLVDQRFVELALTLAHSALTLTSPNPRVGCVLVSAAGAILGQGHTQQAGGAHAEIMALRDAAARGNPVAGATAYVTLEPCSHHGRTGPCCVALADAGVRRVVASLADPNPLVQGNGFRYLQSVGVEVTVGPGAVASRELNLGFFSRLQRKKPWVRMKIASTLDGKTALPNGQSQWITGEAARSDGHAWRARACGVLTGIGTVLQDNPKLDVRLVETLRQPKLIVVDSRLETPADAALFGPKRHVLIYTASTDPVRARPLEAAGATVICLPGPVTSTQHQPKVNLPAMLRDLAAREIGELHVEAGEKLNGSLLREGLIDEFVFYYAPRLMGQGAAIAAFGPLSQLADMVPLTITSHDLCGTDLRVVARVTGRANF